MAATTEIPKEQQSATSKTVTLRIAKYNPNQDSSTKYIEHNVQYEKWTTVLDAILDVKNNHDHSVGVRYSCRQAACGCLLYTSPSPRDGLLSRMPSSA